MKQAFISSLVSLFPLPQYVVVLEDVEKTRLVPIWIGVSEGNAIALEMNGEKFPRPLTHDLMVNMFTELGVKVERVTITDIKDNSYYAEITLSSKGVSHVIDARPSDSLAIAVRTKCPIFIDPQVMEKCPTVEKPISKDEVDKFKDELKTMTAEEFFKKLEASPGKKKNADYILGPDATEMGEDADDDEDFEDESDDDSDVEGDDLDPPLGPKG
ncbi:MAG: bifunctional nuclease family protein [Candidatus Omnitrophica bacterium]|jgi:bifunctional DNase/RNase|nr:bifunctional nuclease family protein [Candidatus Omnitrophota bacterium]